MPMIHDYFGWLQLTLFLGLLLVLTRPTGAYLFRVLDGNGRMFLDPILRPLERTLYFLMSVDPQKEQDWKQYTISLIAFSLVGTLFTYAILRLQHVLPLNPQGLGPFRRPPLLQHRGELYHQHQLAKLRRRIHHVIPFPDGGA